MDIKCPKEPQTNININYVKLLSLSSAKHNFFYGSCRKHATKLSKSIQAIGPFIYNFSHNTQLLIWYLLQWDFFVLFWRLTQANDDSDVDFILIRNFSYRNKIYNFLMKYVRLKEQKCRRINIFAFNLIVWKQRNKLGL